MEFGVEFIGASCNLTYNCLELGSSNLLIFGSNHALALYDLQEKKIVKTVVEHKGKVNCVRFLKQSKEKYILSAGADGLLIIWENLHGGVTGQDSNDTSSKFLIIPKGCHRTDTQTPITVCDGIFLENQKSTVGYITSLSKVFIGSADLEAGTFSILQELNLNQSVALDLFFEFLPGDGMMMGLGMDSGEVSLYGSLEDTTIGAFTKICGLNKHEDWVRCLAITTLENGDRFLATGGEDSFIAVWRFKREDHISTEDFEFQVIEFKKQKILFDSMILGHEGWINALQWNAKGELISCSSDQTVIIWENVEQIWLEKARLGIVGGQIPGGFCSRFNSRFVVTSGFQGAIQIWSWSEEMEDWAIEPSVTGHFNSVTDLDYDCMGRYIVTTSQDQTSRIYCPWGADRWHEISRPQIHGHDIFAVKCAGDYIVSGAEEKMLRAFQPTEIFVTNFKETTGCSISLTNVVEAASVPALGLSNISQSEHLIVESKPLAERLEEDFLRSHTLWPEVSKLYGHGYEICCIGASIAHSIIVSGSNSTTPQFSAIHLWSTENWKNLGEYSFHKLNVTYLEFSIDGNCLLSVSRDRSWAVWKVNPPSNKDDTFTLELKDHGSGHTRALTVGTWAPSGDYFVTGGRDKRLIIWKSEKPEEFNNYRQNLVETFQQPVTAAAVNEDNNIAVGFESGVISIFVFSTEFNGNKPNLICLLNLNTSEAHHGLVKRLKFNPLQKTQLASASADRSVKIYKLCLQV